jgi:uncharacterized protein YkwD
MMASLFKTFAAVLLTAQLVTAQSAERTNHNELIIYTLTNAARLNPVTYRSNFLNTNNARNGCIASQSNSIPALKFNEGLQAAARFHSNDMNVNKCFGHDSCKCSQNCSFDKRIRQFTSGGGTLSENVVIDSSNDAVQYMVGARLLSYSSGSHLSMFRLSLCSRVPAVTLSHVKPADSL